MKNKQTTTRHALKVTFVLIAVAVWASVPLLINRVKAGDSIPILVRTANLISPTGTVNPHGEAEYELYANGDRELEVEIEDVNLAAGTALTALIDGNPVGQIILGTDRRGRLKLRTEDGQTVPVVNQGSTAQVRNGGTVLASGVFGGGGPTPSVSPTASPTGSPSPTVSPTGSPSPSVSPTASPSPSVSPTASPSPSVSPTASPSPSPTGTPNDNNLFAGLTGPTLNGVLPGGYAEFEVHSSRLELEVRLRQINLTAGTSLNIVVNNIQSGNLILEGGGEGRLRLRSDEGDFIPNVVAGSSISVRNGASTILSGVFARITGPTPSPSPTGTPGGTPSPTPTPAMGRSFEANLTGNQVQPPVQTAATGEFKVTLNAAETQATIFGEFHNLGSNQTGARIVTTTGTPIIVRDFGVVGGRNGNFASVTIAVSAALVQQLRTGLWSAVITSVNNPNGEIRGRFTQRSSGSDFDGNGINDIALFRPSSGIWYSQTESGMNAIQLGGADDKLVSGDFDGDGRTDAAVFKSVGDQGVWEMRRSSDNGTTTEQFGLASDTPARGDFDGDGRADLAVYRPSSGTWLIRNSGDASLRTVRYGLAEDRPVPSDIDGDGRDDIVVFRPSTGIWYWLRSSDGQTGAVQFGTTGDVPVRGDFDGDGKQDPTVFRPSTGIWYTLRSSDGQFQATYFGVNGDIPVAGNYDSDGRADIAVFRPSNGNWYILRSLDGSFRAERFGLDGDIPANAR